MIMYCQTIRTVLKSIAHFGMQENGMTKFVIFWATSSVSNLAKVIFFFFFFNNIFILFLSLWHLKSSLLKNSTNLHLFKDLIGWLPLSIWKYTT